MSANLYDGESCMSSHVFSSLHRGVSVEVMLGHVCVLFFHACILASIGHTTERINIQQQGDFIDWL